MLSRTAMKSLLLVLPAVCFPPAATTQTLQNLVVSNVQPSQSGCTPPPAVSSFAITDTIYLYFFVPGLNAGDQAVAQWVNSSNISIATTTWSPLPSGGNWCFTDGLPISQFLSAGQWTAQIYINGRQLGQTPFTIGSGITPIEPRGPSYDGSFDPIATDCSHFDGWALDNNNPNGTVGVDISVSGYGAATVQAGDYRSDVGNHAWNLYNLQLYEDGQSHLVHAYYSGTTQDLPGSPRQFPPAGSSCGGTGGGGGFSLSATPITTTISPGGLAVFVISAQFTGSFTGPVSNFTVSNLQQGTSASFSSSIISSSGGTTSLVVGTTAGTQVGSSQLTITASGGGMKQTASVQLVVAPTGAGNGALTLFDATQATTTDFLGDVPGNPTHYSYTDSNGRSHTYHAFAVVDNTNLFGNTMGFNHNLFLVTVAAEGSGSTLTLRVPSGGNATGDTSSGGDLVLIIPFGLNVNSITGINVSFGNQGSPIADAFECAFGVVASGVVDTMFHSVASGYALLQCANVDLGIPTAGDACSVVYPIINGGSASCLSDPQNNTLYGEKVLNDHQIRYVVWKPAVDGLTESDIVFHLGQPPSQVVTTIQLGGITAYLNTPRSDMLLDNLR